MDTYMKSILACSVISGILEAIVPGTALKKHLRYITALVMLLILLMPLMEIIPSIGSMYGSVEEFLSRIEEAEKQGDSGGKTLILKYSEKNIEQYVKNILKETFSLDPDEVRTELLLNDLEEIVGVKVILTGKASWTDDDKIKTYLFDKLNCLIEIIRK